MRRILLAVLILSLPTATAVVVYLIINKRIPTSREAIGSVTTIAGAGHSGIEDGPARSASFSDPFGVAVDRRGAVYVAEGGESNRIRRITTDGKVETIAGSTEGFADGDAHRAQFNTPSGIAIDQKGNIIIADTSNNRIRKISADGKVTTLAGGGSSGYKDGLASEAQFDGPIGISIDTQGAVFVADAYNDRIRKVSADGMVTTVAGLGSPGFNDGNAAIASFNTPSGVTVDNNGNILVADTGNSTVRKITPQGEVSTINLTSRSETQNNSFRLRHPVGIVVTHDGFIFVTDSSRVIRIAPDGEADAYAGGAIGFADGIGDQARFSGASGIAIDREGNLFVADSQNYLIRHIEPKGPKAVVSDAADVPAAVFVQPPSEAHSRDVIPDLSASGLNAGQTFPWPIQPQNQWHEIAGVVGEARGAPGGVALDHIHSGLDVRGNQGESVLSVMNEKVSAPIAAWDFGGAGEGVQVGLMSYIHTRVGRNEHDEIQNPDKFKPELDSAGKTVAVRLRRGARFKVGDFIGTINRLYHVHLNLGPRNSEANPLVFPFAEFKDTVPPTIEPNGIQVVNLAGVTFSERRNGRLVISGDVDIVVTAYDRVDGNVATRKLGLYRIGYQLIDGKGNAVRGFEQPLMNIEFNRLPWNSSSVFHAYAPGSGVSAYGTPTKFRYIVTNRVRDGEAMDGFLRTSSLAPGDYIIKVIAEDYSGNRATGPLTELAVTVKN
jgi:sugar lactone lactonase YvrE